MALDPDRAELAERLSAVLGRQLPRLDQDTAARAAALALDFFDTELTDAEGYRYLRDKIQAVMVDPDSWCDDTWEPELMGRFVEHMAKATHEECEVCWQPIPAGEQFEIAGYTGGPEALPIRICVRCV